MRDYCPYGMAPASPGQPCPHCGRDPGTLPAGQPPLPAGETSPRALSGGAAFWVREASASPTWGWTPALERKVAIKEYFPTFLVSRETSLSLNVTCYSSQGQGTLREGAGAVSPGGPDHGGPGRHSGDCEGAGPLPGEQHRLYRQEFLEGETLKDLVAREGVIPAGRMLELLEPVAAGHGGHARCRDHSTGTSARTT